MSVSHFDSGSELPMIFEIFMKFNKNPEVGVNIYLKYKSANAGSLVTRDGQHDSDRG